MTVCMPSFPLRLYHVYRLLPVLEPSQHLARPYTEGLHLHDVRLQVACHIIVLQHLERRTHYQSLYGDAVQHLRKEATSSGA